MKNNSLLLFLLLSFAFAQAQFISHGPITGAVTDTSARVYIRSFQPNVFQIQVATDSAFSTYQNFTATSTPLFDNSCITWVHPLQPDTKYFLRFVFDGKTDTISGSFSTFPRTGTRSNFTFTTGSCQESKDMKTFDRMAELKPRFFLHLGDFTYPSYQMGNEYPSQYTAVQESYRRRYQEIRCREMLQHTAIDYIPDDDDLWGGARNSEVAKATYRIEKTAKGKNKIINYMVMDTFDENERFNCFRGYVENFPGYHLEDTSQGLYHSFMYGNCEFIFIDTRSTADNDGEQFDYDSITNRWSFNPKPNHHLISPQQMKWLKEKLQNSTADWKFIAAGLPFNQNIKHLIDIGIKMQDVVVGGGGERGTGFRLAVSFAHYWAGFPNDQKELLDFIKEKKIRDVIFVSGDTHHNECDNGENSGIPELNASGLAVAGTHLGYYMNLISKLMGYPSLKKYMWNGGGGGLGNKNFKNQFGKIDVQGNDFVRLSVVDEDGKKLGTTKIIHSSKVNPRTKYHPPAYQKRLEKHYGKKPTGWMKFAHAIAKGIFKQE